MLKKKKSAKSEKIEKIFFDWKWSKMHWELHEPPLKVKNRLLKIGEIWKKSKIFIIFFTIEVRYRTRPPKTRIFFDWKWSKTHWELLETPLKVKNRLDTLGKIHWKSIRHVLLRNHVKVIIKGFRGRFFSFWAFQRWFHAWAKYTLFNKNKSEIFSRFFRFRRFLRFFFGGFLFMICSLWASPPKILWVPPLSFSIRNA